MNRLDGKTAIITGGARGQGAAEAELFAAAGAQVVITDVLDEGAETAERLGASVDFLHHDVTDEARWAEVVDAVLDEAVRPALARDGGGVNVLEVEGNVVRIQYQGACGGCPSSQSGTLRAIQNILSGTLKEELMVVSGGM